jgi:hypothetical protein
MAFDDLERLDAEKAFTSMRRFEDLPLYHVPFDELAGNDGTEAALRRAVDARRGVTVVGRAGSGKSSVIAHVLGPLAEDLGEQLVPVRVLVGTGDEVLARDVKRFAQQVITTVTGYVTQMEEEDRDKFRTAASDREQQPGRATTTSGTFGIDKVIRLGVGRDVQEFAQTLDRERAGAEMVVNARELVDTLRAQNVELMLILDDTDTWLNLPSSDKRELAEVFFGETLRAFVREVDCPVVAAVHPDYRDLDGYRRARGEILEVEIEIPRLEDGKAAIAAVIGHTLEVHEIAAAVDELFEAKALEGLAWHYVEKQVMRDVILVLQRGLQNACEHRTDAVSGDDVAEAIRYWAANAPRRD